MKLSFLQKDACIAIGLMSGTSADGIDAAVVELRGCGTDTRVRQLGFITLPFSDEARQKILQVAGGAPLDSREICLLNFYLGDLSADACLEACRAAGIQPGVNLLRTVGDEENYKMSGRTVVIGGGNVAIDAARVSLRCGADAVTMVCLEPRDGMPASAEEIAEAEEEGTAIRCGYGPKEFVTENGHVTAVVLKKCTGLYNPEGRFAPTYDENDTITLPCDNVVLSIGQCIEWGDLLDGEAVELGRGQGAVADPVTYQTAQPDVFVGGDVYTGPRFAIDAIAAGKQGAVSIHRFVQPNTSMTIGRNRREFFELDKGNLSIGEYDHTPRQQAAVDEHIDAHRSFRDAHLTLTETQVRAETARCLGCGASVVDPNKCIGCGVCTTKCEFDAIHLHRDLPQCSKMVKSEDKFKAILPYMAKREIKIRFAKKGK